MASEAELDPEVTDVVLDEPCRRQQPILGGSRHRPQLRDLRRQHGAGSPFDRVGAREQGRHLRPGAEFRRFDRGCWIEPRRQLVLGLDGRDVVTLPGVHAPTAACRDSSRELDAVVLDRQGPRLGQDDPPAPARHEGPVSHRKSADVLAGEHGIRSLHRVSAVHDIADSNVVEEDQRGQRPVVDPPLEILLPLNELDLARSQRADGPTLAFDAHVVDHQTLERGIEVDLHLRALFDLHGGPRAVPEVPIALGRLGCDALLRVVQRVQRHARVGRGIRPRRRRGGDHPARLRPHPPLAASLCRARRRGRCSDRG